MNRSVVQRVLVLRERGPLVLGSAAIQGIGFSAVNPERGARRESTMRFTRRRSDRPNLALGRMRSSLEMLECRQLLSGASGIPYYLPADLPPRVVAAQNATPTIYHPLSSSPRQLSFLDNDGKIVTGTDRQGDEWTITVHGPGAVIVTDTTPNDGMLDDDIVTIQLIGTDINKTYVTGEVVQSARLVTDGTIFFNHLTSANGVNSIILNGFTLAETVPPPVDVPPEQNPAIYLPGGVRVLQFHDIDAFIDLAGPEVLYNIVIGQENNPLTVKPSIRLDSIFNTVFDSTLVENPPIPSINPRVNILVNGQLHGLDIVSSTAAPFPAAEQYAFPQVGVTGRTAVRALGIDKLNVVGSAKNVTVSRRQIPFENGFSGINHLGSATFGGNTDAVGLDVAGPIGRLKFLRGQGNPTGDSTAATTYGTPVADYGYPAFGFLGGLVTARRIGSIEAAPANILLQTSNNPTTVQLRVPRTTTFYTRAGNAMTHSAITSSDSIGATTIVGNLQQSEIKAGFDYPSYVAGLQATRAASRIGPLSQHGDLVNSVISASWRPNSNNHYGGAGNTSGPGQIQGHFGGVLVNTGETTALNNTGVGFFARRKIGDLPPPQGPKRIHSVLVRD
jgi:hypothetical protein